MLLIPEPCARCLYILETPFWLANLCTNHLHFASKWVPGNISKRLLLRKRVPRIWFSCKLVLRFSYPSWARWDNLCFKITIIIICVGHLLLSFTLKIQQTLFMLKLWIYETHIFELRNEEISEKKILAVINATYAVEKRKPEKSRFFRLAGIRTLTSAIPVQGSNQLS